MTIVNPPAWLQNGEYPARTDRLVLGSMFQQGGRGSVNDLSVTQASPLGMSVSVLPGSAWVQGTSLPDQGMYHVYNDSIVNVTVSPSSTTNARKDIVVVRVRDAAVSGSTNAAAIEVIPGTPGTSPAAPAVPDDSVLLAILTIPANAASVTKAMIDTSTSPVALLSFNMTQGVKQSSSTTRPSSPRLGEEIIEADTKRVWLWNGSEWSYRGGGRPPVFGVNTSNSVVIGDSSMISTNLTTLPGSDIAYFTLVKSSTNGDKIRVKQSGTYQITAGNMMRRNGAGSYFNGIVVEFDPVAPGWPAGSGGPTQASENTGYDTYSTAHRTAYLPAGTLISTRHICKSAGIVLNHSWTVVTMVP